MEKSRKPLQNHNSVNSISSGIVNRIRAQLAVNNDAWDAKDKWRLDSPIESGRVLRITREMVPKPDEPLELNHVPRWTRQKFMFDTETGVLTPYSDDGQDDKELDKGEWMVFDEQGFVTSNDESKATELTYSIADVAIESGKKNNQEFSVKANKTNVPSKTSLSTSNHSPTSNLDEVIRHDASATGNQQSESVRNEDLSGKKQAVRDDGSLLGKRVTILERKENLYRKIFLAALGIAVIALAFYSFTKRRSSQRTS